MAEHEDRLVEAAPGEQWWAASPQSTRTRPRASPQLRQSMDPFLRRLLLTWSSPAPPRR
jgi:hypothetical protein